MHTVEQFQLSGYNLLSSINYNRDLIRESIALKIQVYISSCSMINNHGISKVNSDYVFDEDGFYSHSNIVN